MPRKCVRVQMTCVGRDGVTLAIELCSKSCVDGYRVAVIENKGCQRKGLQIEPVLFSREEAKHAEDALGMAALQMEKKGFVVVTKAPKSPPCFFQFGLSL